MAANRPFASFVFVLRPLIVTQIPHANDAGSTGIRSISHVRSTLPNRYQRRS